MRTIIVLGALALALALSASAQGVDIAPPSPGYCGFTIPATYYGSVRTSGFERQAGSVLIARSGKFAWQGELVPRGYVVDVYQPLTEPPPCFTGGVVSFSLDGHQCWPWQLWSAGFHKMDLLCVRH